MTTRRLDGVKAAEMYFAYKLAFGSGNAWNIQKYGRYAARQQCYGRGMYQFDALAKRYPTEHDMNYFMSSNLFHTPNAWVTELANSEESHKRYLAMKKNVVSLARTAGQQTKALYEAGHTIEELHDPENGGMLIYQLYQKKIVDKEIFVVYNRVTRLFSRVNKNMFQSSFLTKLEAFEPCVLIQSEDTIQNCRRAIKDAVLENRTQ